MDTMMWEAKAAEGRGPELIGWLHKKVLPGLRTYPGCERVELFSSSDSSAAVTEAPIERVVVIAIVPAGPPTELPPPPEELVARPPHTWCFRRVDSRS